MRPRRYTNLVIEKLGRSNDDTVISLLNYMSDNAVKDWAIENNIIDVNDIYSNNYSDEAYVAEYYYDPIEKLWRTDIKDESNNIVRFAYAPSEDEIKYEIECIASSEFDIIRVIKTKFYK